MTSLRRRLMLTLLAGVMLGGLAGTAGLYLQAMEELDELFDDRLRTIGDNLRLETLARDSPMESPEDDDDIVIQRWGHDGQLLFRSSAEKRAPAPRTPGFSMTEERRHDWRSYTRVTPDGGYLQVAQEMSARREFAVGSAFRLLLPLLAVLPLIGVFSIWTVSRQLRPLQNLAEQINTRGALTRSTIVVPEAPVELAPVVKALNELLSRQAEASGRQQAFLADAAHELRTPLAVLSLQAQRAQQAGGAAERDEALDSLRRGIERATRLVTQLLDLARSEPAAAHGAAAVAVDLETLVKLVLADLYPLAAHKGVDLGLAASQPCMVKGDPESLRSLIGNLVDNAIRYTPAGGRIDVTLAPNGSNAVFVVTDTGPGIPLEMRRRLFERFVRGGQADAGGTGLGLAIAKQTAIRHGGSIALGEGEGGRGLRASVMLPLGKG